jgi:diguanylate cyclase (GGDEF)-like protein
VTVSIGLADAGRRGATPAGVIKAADQALYRAKRAGRNRVSV